MGASDVLPRAPERDSRESREQEVAERVLRSVVHRGLAPDAGVRTLVVPAGRFNGDLLLTARHPGGRLHLLLGDFIGDRARYTASDVLEHLLSGLDAGRERDAVLSGH